MRKLEGCAVYSVEWNADSVLIATNGCGSYFGSSNVFLFHDDSIELQIYNNIEGYNRGKVIAYLEKEIDNFFVLKDVFSGKKDTLDLETFVSEKELEALDDYVFALEALEPLSQNETLVFSGDTVFLSFLCKDTFYLSNLE